MSKEMDFYVGKVVKNEEGGLEIATQPDLMEKLKFKENDVLVFIPQNSDTIVIRRVSQEEFEALKS